MFHQNIRLPGVYIFNARADPADGMQSAPIFCTMSTLQIIGANDASEKVLVFPKFKVIFYDGSFTGTNVTVDNTTGTKYKYVAGLNQASSCKVYYDNVEIPNIFSTTGT
jgi:hypothetical protein